MKGLVGSGYTGQEHDEDLALINFRGRIYDPVIRRFLSADPHVTHPLSGQSYNRYSYVVNDPTNLIDPTGFDDIGQEYGGWGTEYTSGGFESTYGNDYSGCFTRVDGATPVHAGGSGGVGWSTIGGVNVGAPVQAVERQRQVSMPTGPSSPAGAIVGPVVKADADVDKWNPYSEEGRIHQALFGAEPPLQDPLEPYGPAMASLGVSFIPGLNSYMVLNDPAASTASKVLAVGSDALSVIGVGTVLKLGAKGVAIGKGVVLGGKVAEGVVVAEDVAAQLGGSYGAVRRMATKLGLGGEVHHMPSWGATNAAGVKGVTQWSAPSIWMETADHYNTLSHGGFAASPGYRATQEMLIRNGRRLDAMKMDVDSIRAIFGSKYDVAIQQMGEYIWKFHE